MSVWIHRSDLIQPRSRHLFGELKIVKVWGYNLALGPDWIEFKQVAIDKPRKRAKIKS